jgi:hypothetical protein
MDLGTAVLSLANRLADAWGMHPSEAVTLLTGALVVASLFLMFWYAWDQFLAIRTMRGGWKVLAFLPIAPVGYYVTAAITTRLGNLGPLPFIVPFSRADLALVFALLFLYLLSIAPGASRRDQNLSQIVLPRSMQKALIVFAGGAGANMLFVAWIFALLASAPAKPSQYESSIYITAFDPNGERIVTTSGNTARIWDARTGAPIGKPLQHRYVVTSASFDPAGERVVTASGDNTAHIWDASTGAPIGKPLQHQGGVYSAAFDPKGERVVTASGDTALIWDARTGEPIGKPLQHQDRVSSAAFDPTGERIVTASGNTARIWDARTGAPIGKPMQYQGDVHGRIGPKASESSPPQGTRPP